ncbi:MAG: LLM class flavin-dependent oxidoreductase [Anaerolineales bacterium]|jgi:hypothetical protein
MKFAIYSHTYHPYSNPSILAELAEEAEQAGWDGYFLWDVLPSKGSAVTADPWISLAAMAVKTKRITLGPMITPLARRRPWKVALEALSLDHLSNGRLILGVGLGATSNYETWGEESDPKIRAQKLDESLEIITGLWSGETITHDGIHYKIDPVQFSQRPIQRPRIPIWIAGYWPNKAPMRRAALWEGAFPFKGDMQNFDEMLSPSQVKEIITYISQHRNNPSPIEIAHAGVSSEENAPERSDLIREYAKAGVTWWLEHIYPDRFTPEESRQWIRKGPPNI